MWSFLGNPTPSSVFGLYLLLLSPLPPPSLASLNMSNVPCGVIARGSRRFHARIMGGAAIHITDFPNAVSIKKNGEHYCGGILIHENYVLTAAHCVHSKVPNVWTATVGEQRSDDRDDGEQTFSVEEIILHPKYKFPKFIFDLALLKLKDTVRWSKSAQPVCLPEVGQHRSGRMGYLAGWGYDNESRKGGHPTGNLHMARLPILENEVCEEWFYSQGKNITLRPEHLCAGHEIGQEDGCQGDSGGGLVSVDNGQLVLVGIMSAGIGCGRERLPGVYTRVERFTGWIQEQIDLGQERDGRSYWDNDSRRPRRQSRYSDDGERERDRPRRNRRRRRPRN